MDRNAPGPDYQRAATALRAGRSVILPTDTIYGLAAALSKPDAVEQLWALKGRPGDVPIAVLCADVTQAATLADFTPLATDLARRHWPGALTLVVAGTGGIGQLVGAADGSVGLRCPDHDGVRWLAERVGPLAVTSANRHGEPTPETVAAASSLFPEVATTVDGGVCAGLASTVVDVRGERPVVLRQGAIPI